MNFLKKQIKLCKIKAIKKASAQTLAFEFLMSGI
tara:strand:+ start:739 stop:840 length:102 start_codon:yes stop_codon:yes gene_type:complete